MEKSYSASYAAAGVDITAGYKAVDLMKQHVARTMNEHCIGGLGGFEFFGTWCPAQVLVGFGWFWVGHAREELMR